MAAVEPIVATTPQERQPWYVRWDVATFAPAIVLVTLMHWSVIQSIANANWANGLNVLVSIALPALLVGMIFARLSWLPGWMAHILSAILGIAWSIQRVGPLLVNEIALELSPTLAERLTSWGDWMTEIAIRTAIWLRILGAGGRGEDIVLFIVALALLSWVLGYTTSWMLFRAGWVWRAVLLNAVVILVNYTFTAPKPNVLFFIFLIAALLLIAHQHVVQQQRAWRSALVEFPTFISWRFLLATALFCAGMVLLTGLLPGNVSSEQAAQVWAVIRSPFTAMREGWEVAFSTINAPPGTAGTAFATRDVRVGGGRTLSTEVVMRVRAPLFDYWRAVAFDRYTGRGWQNLVGERARAAMGVATREQARTALDPGVLVPPAELSRAALLTQTVEMAQERSDRLLMFSGQFATAGMPVYIQHGFISNDAGQLLPNFAETTGVFAQGAIARGQTYTVSVYFAPADIQSLRNAGTDYPAWVSNYYTQLPDTVTDRTRELAQQIVAEAGATTPYDQAEAIQTYLRRLTYDETRPSPPPNRDWVDYFLFDGQRGYCDDFSTSMIVLLRSLDIPARWVQGYAGGTLDEEANAYVVRENIAHSWPEVYFPGFGWQRFEPTPAAYTSLPDRPDVPEDIGDLVEEDRSIEGRGDTLGSDDPFDEFIDELNSSGGGDPEELLRLLEAQRRAQLQQRLLIAAGVLVLIALAVGVFFVYLNNEVQGLSPAAAVYTRMTRLAAWAGLAQAPNVTPHEYARQLAQHVPDQKPAIERIVNAYVAERYHPRGSSPVEGLDEDWRDLRPSLLNRMAARLGATFRPKRTDQGRRG